MVYTACGISSLSLAFGFAFGLAFGEALRSAAGAVGRMHDTSGDPLDDTSGSGAGGSAGERVCGSPNRAILCWWIPLSVHQCWSPMLP